MSSPYAKHIGEKVQDLDGKVYEITNTGSIKRLSPKLSGKDRRLARSMAKMMNNVK